MEVERIIVCGISGTKASDVGSKLVHELNKDEAHPAVLSKFEDYLLKEYEKECGRRRDITSLLKLPPNQFKKIFDMTWEKGEFFKNENSCKYHVITAHIVYHPKLTSSFFSYLTSTHLANHRVSKVIVVIDDVFDIYARLHGYTQFPSGTPLSQASESILSDLTDILNWRTLEHSHAFSLANSLNAELMIVANKHRIETFKDLVLSNKPTLYLSHPISQPRRDGLRSADSQLFVEMLSNLTHELSRNFTVFAPTTIDEYRFEQIRYRAVINGEEKNRSTTLPKVLDRWPDVFQPTIACTNWVPNIENIEDSMLKSLKEFANDSIVENDILSDFLTWARERRLPDKEIDNIVSMLYSRLDILMQQIVDQITARDVALVRQSKHIFVFRPIYKGNRSGGVRREIGYFRERFEHGQNNNSIMLVYSSPKMTADMLGLKSIVVQSILAYQRLFSFEQRNSEYIHSKIDVDKVVEFARARSSLAMVGQFEGIISDAGLRFSNLGSEGPLPDANANEEARSFVNEIRNELAYCIGVPCEANTICVSDIPPWTHDMSNAERRQSIDDICSQISKAVISSPRAEEA